MIPSVVFWLFATVCVVGLILDVLFTIVPGLHNLDVSASFIETPPNTIAQNAGNTNPNASAQNTNADASSTNTNATAQNTTNEDITNQTPPCGSEASTDNKWWIAPLVIGLIFFVVIPISILSYGFFQYFRTNGENGTKPTKTANKNLDLVRIVPNHDGPPQMSNRGAVPKTDGL